MIIGYCYNVIPTTKTAILIGFIKNICDALRDLVPFVQFKNAKNTNGGVLLLVNLQALACNFAKSITHRWVFFTFFKLYEWY